MPVLYPGRFCGRTSFCQCLYKFLMVKSFILLQATNKKVVKADAYVAGYSNTHPFPFLLWYGHALSFHFSGIFCAYLLFYLMAACDVPGIKKLLPSQWRESKFFDNIYELVGVPVVTVQLRYNGWVTELQDLERSRWISLLHWYSFVWKAFKDQVYYILLFYFLRFLDK